MPVPAASAGAGRGPGPGARGGPQRQLPAALPLHWPTGSSRASGSPQARTKPTQACLPRRGALCTALKLARMLTWGEWIYELRTIISSCVHVKISIIVGTAGGLPQNLGHSSRGTQPRSVVPLVGSSRLEVLVMRTGAFRLRCHFPQNRTNAEAGKMSSDTQLTLAHARGDWFHRFGPNWYVRIDDSREFIRALLKKSRKNRTLWSHKLRQ